MDFGTFLRKKQHLNETGGAPSSARESAIGGGFTDRGEGPYREMHFQRNFHGFDEDNQFYRRDTATFSAYDREYHGNRDLDYGPGFNCGNQDQNELPQDEAFACGQSWKCPLPEKRGRGYGTDPWPGGDPGSGWHDTGRGDNRGAPGSSSYRGHSEVVPHRGRGSSGFTRGGFQDKRQVRTYEDPDTSNRDFSRKDEYGTDFEEQYGNSEFQRNSDEVGDAAITSAPHPVSDGVSTSFYDTKTETVQRNIPANSPQTNSEIRLEGNVTAKEEKTNTERKEEEAHGEGEEDEEESEEEDETTRAIKKLPARHNRGLMSTLMGLAEQEVQHKKPEPLPQPVKSKDDEESEDRNTVPDTISEDDYLKNGITQDMLLEPSVGDRDLLPEEIGRGSNREELFCKLCQVQTTSVGNFSDHLSGRSHKAKLDSWKKGTFIPKPKRKPPPVGEIAQKSALLEIAENSLEPLLGLSYVTEYHSTIGVICVCNLCGVKFDFNTGLSHITGTKHRLHYMKEKRLSVYKHLKNFGGKRSELKAVLDELTFETEKEDGRGTPVVKVYQPAKTEEEENMTVNDILAEENSDEKGKTSAAASDDMTDEQREELRRQAVLARRLTGNTSFHDWVNQAFEQSRKNYEAKRARSPSPSFRDDKAEMQGGRMDAERLGPPEMAYRDRREFDGERRNRPVFDPDYPYPRDPYLPHPRYPPHPPPPPAWSRAPYKRPDLPSHPPLDPYDPIARLPPRPPTYDPYIDPPRRITGPYLDPDPLRRISRAPGGYLDPDPLKRVLKSESRLDPDPLKRKLPAVKPTVIDYGHGSSSKAETAKPSSTPAHRRKAGKWEEDLQNILCLGMEKRAPDSLALLSSTYSSPEKSPSPVPEKKYAKPTRALPFSKSYLEMPEALKKLKDNEERQGVCGSVEFESRRNPEAERFPRTERKEKGLGSSVVPFRKDSKQRSSQNPDLSRRRSKSPRFSKYHKSRSPDLKRRRSRSPGHSRHHKSPDLRKRTSRSPGFSEHYKSISPDLKRRRSRSPGHSRHYKSPDLRKQTSRSPGLSKHKSRNPDLRTFEKKRTSRSPGHFKHHFLSKKRRSGSPRKHEIVVEKSRHDEDVDLLSMRPKSGEKSLKLEQNRSSSTSQHAREFQDILLETDEDTQAEKIASLLLEMSGSLASEDPSKALQALFSNSELASALLAAKSKNKKCESESSLNRARSSVDKTEGKPRASSSRSPFEPSHSPSPVSSRTRTLRDRPSLPKARLPSPRDVIMLESSPPPRPPPREKVTFSLSGFGRPSSQSVRSTLPIDFGEEDEEED